MTQVFAAAAVVAVLGFGAHRADAATWTGKISDAMCGLSHDAMTAKGKKGTDKSCTEMCVKGGSTYVLVTDGKVLKIANQTFKGLAEFAGDAVRLTGDVKGDTVTVTALERAK
jgi:hypothetical protein